jgi:hypothetical protein
MKRSMPAASTPAEVMKAVNKLIIKNAKASLSNDETITAGDDVNMTANDNETPSFDCPMTGPSLTAMMLSCPPMTMILPNLSELCFVDYTSVPFCGA